MKKIMLLLLVFLLIGAMPGVALAGLSDNQATVAGMYGDYHLVVDTDNQLWTRTDWEAKGRQRAKAATYSYHFSRQGTGVQLEVQYTKDGPDGRVRSERFTPDNAISIRDFKQYFPEIYTFLASPKAAFFATYADLTANFREPASPVTMAVVVRDDSAPGPYYTLLCFNIADEGRLIKDVQYIDGGTYIREFTLERVAKYDVHENLNVSGSPWISIKNYF